MANERLGRTAEAISHYNNFLAIPAKGQNKNATLELQKMPNRASRH